MAKILLALGLGAAAYVLLNRGPREWLVEQAKEASDVGVSFLLRAGSQFSRELTPDGWTEQRLWHQQRLRDLRGVGREG